MRFDLMLHTLRTSNQESAPSLGAGHRVALPSRSVEELPVYGCSPLLLSLSFPAMEWIGSLSCDDSPLLGARMDDCGNPDCVHIVARIQLHIALTYRCFYYTLWYGDGVWD